MKVAIGYLFTSILLLAACAPDDVPLSVRAAHMLPPVAVPASGETVQIGLDGIGVADDPAIWSSPVSPARSLIVGTDKRAGLYVYDPDGNIRGSSLSGRYNNVALHAGQFGTIVVASDRTDPASARLAVFLLNPTGAVLTPLASVPSGPGEAYGVCLAPATRAAGVGAPDEIAVYLTTKEGVFRETLISHKDGAVTYRTSSSWHFQSQVEGCAVDPRTGDVFVGEENVAIWRIEATNHSVSPARFFPPTLML